MSNVSAWCIRISIHAPIVGCDGLFLCHQWLIIISIHAPIVGCDFFRLPQISGLCQFQSTHPSWGATLYIEGTLAKNSIFQSTHPSWGATMFTYILKTPTEISIHAPIVGCDIFNSIFVYNFLDNFNPRTHRGVRHKAFLFLLLIQQISIHAPIVGCDYTSLFKILILLISIHAPIVGCDETTFQLST